MAFITNEAIPVIPLPNRSFDPSDSHDAFCGERLPRSQDVFQRPASMHPDHDVDMVGHDDPWTDIVAFAGEALPVVPNDLSDVETAQDAFPMSRICPRFDPQSAFFRTLTVWNGIEVPFHGLDGVVGHRIGQTIGDGLPRVGGVEMGKIAASTPAGVSDLRNRTPLAGFGIMGEPD